MMNFKNSKIRRTRKTLLSLLTIVILSTIHSDLVMAVQTGDTTTYNFTGMLILVTPCSVNGDQPVIVTFGNVGISKIESKKYIQDLNYSLNCGGATSASKVTMTIRATSVAWKEKTMATDVDGLGVQILNEGSPVELNTPIEVPDPANPPTLQVMLVKKPSAVLPEREFTALGTLIVDYV